jgi:hypothetical protein
MRKPVSQPLQFAAETPRRAARDPWLLGFTLLGLALRVVYSLADPLGMIGDQIQYEQLARNFKSYWGMGLSSQTFWASHTVVRPPLYPLFLAINYSLGLGRGAVHIEQSVFLTAACLALAVLAASVVSIRAGRLTAAIAALLPPLVMMPNGILSDTISASLSAFCVCLLVVAWNERSFRRFVLELVGAALLAAAATLSHPNVVVIFLPLLATALFARREWRERGLAVGAAALAALVLFLPWMIRNQHEAGTLTPLASNDTLTSRGVHLPVYKASGEFGAKKRADYYFTPTPPGVTPQQALSRPLNYQTARLVNTRKTLIHNLKHHPLKQIDTSLFWQRELWLVPFDNWAQYGARPRVPWTLTEVLHLLALALALAGAWFGRRLVLVRMAVAFAVLISLPYLIIVPTPRYALPALLVLSPVAGIGASALLDRVPGTRSTSRKPEFSGVPEPS